MLMLMAVTPGLVRYSVAMQSMGAVVWPLADAVIAGCTRDLCSALLTPHSGWTPTCWQPAL
jgi:hypothetical protein